MKPRALKAWIVVNADQKSSRTGPDRVGTALAALKPVVPGFRLRFERAAGDEIQGLTDDPVAALAAVSILLRQGDWHLGLGIGGVEEPLPASTREARGPAYVAAREAVRTARPGSPQVIGFGDSTRQLASRDAESALQLVGYILTRRTFAGWQVAELLDQGLAGVQVAERLGVSASAVSQRAQAAGYEPVRRGFELAVRCLRKALAT